MRLPDSLFACILVGSLVLPGLSALAQENVSFLAEQTLSLGQETAFLDAADLDGDGDDDLAVTGLLGDLIVFLNEGGTLRRVPDSPFVGNSPVHVLAATLDGDSIPDLVITDSSNSSTLVLVGNGDGLYDPPLSLRVQSSPRQSAVTDFNDDGRLDIVTINTLGRSISVLLQLPNAVLNFADAIHIEVGPSPHSVIADDFNGDNFGDIAVAIGDEDRLNFLLGAGDGSFTSTSFPVGFVPRWLASADLDQNGALDVAVANQNSNTVTLLLGDGVGSLEAGDDVPLTNQPQWIGADDMDGDGRPDLATVVIDIVNDRADVQVLLARDDGTYEPPLVALSRSGLPIVDFADFGSDGIRDLVVGGTDSDQVTVLTGRGDGTFLSRTTLEVSAGPRSAVVGDIDGDGAADVVAAVESGTLAFFPGDGSGGFAERQDPSAGGGVLRDIAIGDLDGSAPLDLVVVDFLRGRARVLLGRQGDVPQSGQSLNAGILPTRVLLAFLDSDANLDLAVLGSLEVQVFTGSGDGTFISGTAVPVSGVGEQFAAGDIDGDGSNDIAVGIPGNVEVFFGDGAALFPRSLKLTVPSSMAPTVAVGHLDGDTAADVVAATVEGEALIFFGTLQGDPTDPVSVLTRARNSAALISDLNADGLAELIVASDRPNAVTVFETPGDRMFQAGATVPVGEDPVSIAAGDLNGDGRLDLVTADLCDQCTDDTLSVVFQSPGGEPTFRRGDSSGEGRLDLSDAVMTLNFLFLGFESPGCRDAADTDDDGRLLIADSILLLNWLFQGGPEPASPGPHDCGPDPTPDNLPHCNYDC